MALPAAAQAQLDALRSEQAPESTPTAPVEPTPTAPTPREGAESVTVSREEFNTLQANAGRVKAAEGKAEMAQMEIEALQTRLTALEQASKGSGEGSERPPTPPTEIDDWKPAEVKFTDKDTEDYGDSREYIEKVVRSVLNEELPKIVSLLNGKIGKLNESVESTARRTEGVESRDFNDQVKNALKNESIDFDAVVNHEHWMAFVESEDPNMEYPYKVVLADAVNRKKLNTVIRVFREFATKYGLGKKPATTGYEGVIPGSGSKVPEGEGEPTNLKFSDRKAAHKKFINGEMSQAEYQRIADEFTKAEHEGRIDYDA